MGWSLGADVRGMYREDSEFAKQEVVGHCETCQEAVTLAELWDRHTECFNCFYSKTILKGAR